MRNVLHQLTNRTIQTKSRPGRYADGGGLYLIVTRSGTKNWCFMYRWGEKRPELGLGGYPAVSLAQARQRADLLREALHDLPKRDPRAVLQAMKQPPVSKQTLAEFTEGFLERILTDFKNPKHRQQWGNSLRTYAAPINGMAIDEIETEHVLKVLTPIWDSKRETARRVQGRLERIFDAARAQGLRSGDNPARWRGHLDTTLPNTRPNRKHHKALPFRQLGDFMTSLQAVNSMSALCLEFLILTATRSGEARGAKWDEIDLEAGIWTIPPERMKMSRQHRVPLSERALEILRQLHDVRSSDFVFPGLRGDKGLSEAALRKLLGELSKDGLTVHGFRSTFRDWVFEATDFPRELAEIALSHNVGDATERAYRRGDAIEKRRRLMQVWADYTSHL